MKDVCRQEYDTDMRTLIKEEIEISKRLEEAKKLRETLYGRSDN